MHSFISNIYNYGYTSGQNKNTLDYLIYVHLIELWNYINAKTNVTQVQKGRYQNHVFTYIGYSYLM